MSTDLISLFKNTRFISKSVLLTHTNKCKNRTVVYDGVLSGRDKLESDKPNALIHFVKGGSVNTGYTLAKKGKDVAILNFANALVPGGGVECGGTAQEESICQCSNLYESLIIPDCMKKFYKFNRAHDQGIYSNRLIYSPGVAIFRDDTTYKKVPKKFVDIITCPAPSATLKDDFAYRVYVRRIEQIVLSAIKHDATTLVLGAWGCGVFHQNPYVMAKAFASVLNKYACFFDDIVFAILDTPSYNGRPNTYEIFLNQIKRRYLGLVRETTADAIR